MCEERMGKVVLVNKFLAWREEIPEQAGRRAQRYG